MGEVVEISMVTKTPDIYEQLLFFLTSYINEDYIIQSIKAMDNWKYENIVILNSLSDANKLAQDKIVCIDINTNNKYLGVSVEKKKDTFCIEGWINSNDEITGQDYERFINSFVDAFIHNKSIKVCAIGKEICVDYDLGIGSAIENAHNIDLWMVCSSEYIISEKTNTKFIVIK